MLAVALILAGCHAASPAERAETARSAGSDLERAAVAAGIVTDPASRSIVGAWSLDTDRACIVPDRANARQGRIGVVIDLGDGQGCVASGSVRHAGDLLDVRLGGCRMKARFDGARIVFPAEVAAACDRLCTGRATLAAMTVERQSGSIAEAQSLRAPSGRMLCGVD